MKTTLLMRALIGAGLLVQVSPMNAATFSVNPVRVYLTEGGSSSLVSLKNESDRPIRFEISTSDWSQARDGEIVLAPTGDITVLPGLIELAPGEERNVRIGNMNRAPLTTERTYRVFFEELPSNDAQPESGSQIRILTKMGVPVFVQPRNRNALPVIGEVSMDDKAVRFAVRNDGNTHFVTTGVRVDAIDANGSSLYEKKVEGWYMLAGGVREYTFPFDRGICKTAAKIRVIVDTDVIESGKPMALQMERPATEVCGK